MKKTIILVVSWACVVLTMIIIFCFSAQNREESRETSSGVIKDVLSIVMPEEEITTDVVKKYQFPFRKAAHFSIYMILGFALANAFEYTLNKMWYFSYPCSVFVSALYAISDEWHQGFSEGRGPSAFDVLIDTAGALFGVLFFAAFVYLYFRLTLKILVYRKNKRSIAE